MSQDEGEVKLNRVTEGVEVGRRVRLPRGAEPPIRVYVNGVERSEGSDYRIRGGEIVFERPIVKEGKVGGLRWLAMLLGPVRHLPQARDGRRGVPPGRPGQARLRRRDPAE